MQGIHLRKYGVAATVDFVLYEVDGVDFRTDWTPAAGDVFMMRDEAAEEQVTNAAGNADLSTLVTDEGRGYSITLALEDMQAARVVVYLVDQATKAFLDWPIIIETYGHASAMHAFDLDTAAEACSGTIVVDTADTIFDLTATSGTLSTQDDTCNNMIICIFDNSGSVYETARITDYDGTNTRITIDHELTFPVDDGVDTWVIYRNAYAPVGAASITEGDKNDIVDKMYEELDADHMTPGTKGLKIHHSGRGRY